MDIESISAEAVHAAEEAVFLKLEEFFRISAIKCREPKPYLNEQALHVIAKGVVNITLKKINAGLKELGL